MTPAPDEERDTAATDRKRLVEGLALAVGTATGAALLEQIVLVSRTPDAIALVLWFGLLYALAAALLVGLPAHLVLQRLKITALLPYLVVGAIAGLAIPILTGPLNQTWRTGLRGAPEFVLPGLVGAGAFWAIVVRPRPRVPKS